MNAVETGLGRIPSLLIDTNLLVLFVVGSVAPHRIETFKRTSKYNKADFDLLLRLLSQADRLYTLPHVLSEVSNLTDLPGVLRRQGLQVLKQTMALLVEPHLPSLRASEEDVYGRLGLTDAAISSAARELGCAVLTDDLDLYLVLSRRHAEVINFTHQKALAQGL